MIVRYIDDTERARLDSAGRPPQIEFNHRSDMLHRNADGEPIRAYLHGSFLDDAGNDLYQNMMECHGGGAVVIPWDSTNRRVGLKKKRRPVVHSAIADEINRLWDRYIAVSTAQLHQFGVELFPLLGNDTLEFPQGYRKKGETGVANAVRVLREQTSLVPFGPLKLLDGIHMDPSNRVSPVLFYLAKVDPTLRMLPYEDDILWVNDEQFLLNDLIVSAFTLAPYRALKRQRVF